MEEGKRNKKEKILTIALVITIALILSLVGYISYDKFNTISNEKTKVDNKQLKKQKNKVDNTKEEKEEEIVENSIKEDLKKKMLVLENYLYVLRENSNETNIYYKDFKSSDVSEDIKLTTVINSLYQDEKYSNLTTNYDFGSLSNLKEGMVQMETESVTNEYFNLFGSKTVNHKTLDNQCPVMIFDSTNNKYYVNAGCGKTSRIKLYTYINKYTKKSNEAYLYVNLASYDEETNKLYRDYERQQEYQGESIDNKINESNYQEFCEYKYTFTKNTDGSYYFSSLARIK